MPFRGLVKWLVSNTSRETTSGQFIAEIDGLRFIAIFCVIFSHISGYVTTKTGRNTEHDPLVALFTHCDIGVQLFFIISGFVIALPFAKGHFTGCRVPQLGRYFSRRLTRLEPPYILNLLILYAMIKLTAGEKAGDLMPHLLASMGYVHNVIYGQLSAINAVAWSLEVELQFYIVAPLITSVFMIRSKIGRRSILIALIVFFALLNFTIDGDSIARYKLSLLSGAQFFLTGFLLVDVYLSDWNEKPEKTLAWDVMAALAWVVFWALLFQGRLGMLFIVVPMFVAYCAAFRGVWTNRLLCYPVIYIIGGMCYTIYLYHYPLISGVGRFLIQSYFLNYMPLWLAIIAAGVVLVPLIVVFSALMFVLIEKPCMKKNWHVQVLHRLRLQWA